MQLSDFAYDLPPELIAQAPLAERSSSRLLVLDRHSGELKDQIFKDIVDFIQPNDLLVFNDTKVFPARLYGKKATGGKVEILIERALSETTAWVHIKANKPPKPQNVLHFAGNATAIVEARENDLFRVSFSGIDSLYDYLEQYGHIPLPPYIQRSDQNEDQTTDRQRYQTVYAEKRGAVAAPTAGLHFDDATLSSITAKGVATASVTLHVGAGTFQPIRVDNIEQHIMHAEYICVPETTVEAVNACKQRGGRVIAVGTTTVRSLESAVIDGKMQPFSGDTRLFIKPDYQFQAVDVILTNFHLPESTLLLLVSAFAGYKNYQQAYHHAIKSSYRFFSYGDAMLII
ncbi:MAG: tRNA preQ1(34) S-adenosylmethionine ribosyltransferase-isomerase QueA [bacterium]